MEKQGKPDKNKDIIDRILDIFEVNHSCYGSRRIVEELRGEDKIVNRKKVLRIMKQNALVPIQRKKRRVPGSIALAEADPNLLDRNFESIRPNEKWVTDITYIRMKKGWAYLSVILDCYGRKVVSWEMADRMKAELVVLTIDKALYTNKLTEPVIIHSDRGTQYGSTIVKEALKNKFIKKSMSGKASCYDNAVVESFFKTLKTDTKYKVYENIDEAKNNIFKYIEMYYNTKRRHSFNGYRTPDEVHKQYYNN